jgi:tetratricopeptide (TPR) repeat protein
MIVQLFTLVKNGPRCYVKRMCRFIKLGICLVFYVAPLYAQSGDQAEKLRHGKEAMATGRFGEAISIYRELVQALPNNPGPIMNLGLALHMAGREREAVNEFQTVLKLEPSHMPARLFLGAAYLGLKAPDKAVEPLRAVVRAQPDNREARLFLGEALLSLEHFQEAAEQYERLSKLDPQNPKIWNGLGLSYEGLTTPSFEALERAAPESAYWLVLVAEALAKMPNMRGVHTMLAQIYQKEGHSDWAAIEQEKRKQAAAPGLCKQC